MLYLFTLTLAIFMTEGALLAATQFFISGTGQSVVAIDPSLPRAGAGDESLS